MRKFGFLTLLSVCLMGFTLGCGDTADTTDTTVTEPAPPAPAEPIGDDVNDDVTEVPAE